MLKGQQRARNRFTRCGAYGAAPNVEINQRGVGRRLFDMSIHLSHRPAATRMVTDSGRLQEAVTGNPALP